jgi:hypothetical protein
VKTIKNARIPKVLGHHLLLGKYLLLMRYSAQWSQLLVQVTSILGMNPNNVTVKTTYADLCPCMQVVNSKINK